MSVLSLGDPAVINSGWATQWEDLMAQSLNEDFDELYAYHGLQRLVGMQRGQLNGGHTAITTKTFAQEWSLDPTENWLAFDQDDNGNGTWNLEQTRTANPVNEITGITETTGPSWTTPAYDPAGNTRTQPQPDDPTKSFTAAWNRLVKLVDDDTSDTVAEYQYDAAGRRIVKKLYEDNTLDHTRHLYLSPDWQTLEERIDAST